MAKQKEKARRSRPKQHNKRLGGYGKLSMVKELKKKYRLNMLGLIETNREVVTKFDVARLWGCAMVGWEFVESVGASGGLLLMNFNEILRLEERKGVVRLPASAEDFKVCVQVLQLVELPLTDRKFTWFQGRSCRRIDRILVSLEWLEEFPDTRLKGGSRGLSDHCPLILEDSKLYAGPRPFRSLDSWFAHEGFLKLVKDEWRNLGDDTFTNKLKALTVPLRRWHKDKFEDMDSRIKKFKEEIKKIDDMVSVGSYDGTMEARRKALVTYCAKWYVIKEIHWKQMSRSQHARDMDKNTRYFHNLASARRRNNSIVSLVINGRLVRNQDRIKTVITCFYKELYRQEYALLIGIREGLVKKIDDEETSLLEEMPSAEKVREAVWDCESSKAPGCDGYNMNFIKKYWGELG
ncbi:uncharacterized protein [Arachis hypogaea]|uniref:uncharacterized protein n=1 Tax=Arachis hypogaea TaxID=3818 RepID=UPI003B21F5C4